MCSSMNASLRIIINTKIWIHIASHTVCRFNLSLMFTTIFTSTYLLAVDRYFKTCKPLSNVYNVRTGKKICIAVV